jgi:hypothetical protein
MTLISKLKSTRTIKQCLQNVNIRQQLQILLNGRMKNYLPLFVGSR